MHRAIFLDRDGVINRKAPEGQYVTRWEDFEILPGVAEAITSFNKAGFRVIVVTNQRCVAKGLLTGEQLEALHAKMCDTLAAAGAAIDAVYCCRHDIQPACDCRKPKPGLLLQAAKEREIDLPGSWMIGDSMSDIEAGRAAGCQTLRICSNLDDSPTDKTLSAGSLFEAATGALRFGVVSQDHGH